MDLYKKCVQGMGMRPGMPSVWLFFLTCSWIVTPRLNVCSYSSLQTVNKFAITTLCLYIFQLIFFLLEKCSVNESRCSIGMWSFCGCVLIVALQERTSEQNFMDVLGEASEIVSPGSEKGQGIMEPSCLITFMIMWNATGTGCRLESSNSERERLLLSLCSALFLNSLTFFLCRFNNTAILSSIVIGWVFFSIVKDLNDCSSLK